MFQSKRRLTAIVLLVVFALGGCSLRAPMKRFATKEEIGTVHVAVQSIAKFDDEYTDQLQPHFELTTADALNAIAQTQVSEMERFRALLAEVKAAGDKKTLSTERVTDKGEVTTDKVTKKRDPGDLSTVGLPDAEERSNDAADVLTDANVQFDPGLRYRTASALLQEVALFNRYVRDAAVSRGSVPYVVRLLITVNPSARREPYDVYTTISFFTTGAPDTSSAEFTAQLFSLNARSYKDEFSKLTRKGETAPLKECNDAVEIIPLFVTDNIESSLNSVANERVVDVSGGFSAWLSHLAAVFGFRGQATDRDRSLARALNGLTTISRVGNNTVLARLGAASANNQYEMIARTYNVTLLALVPSSAKLAGYSTNAAPGSAFDYLTRTVTPCREIAFAAHSTFRDAERGTEARTAALKRRDLLLASIANAWEVKDKAVAVSTLERLLPHAQFGDYTGFRKTLANLPADDPFKTRSIANAHMQYTLWHDLVALDDKSGRSYGTFELPEPVSQFFTDQDVTLFDDEKTTTVVLNNARNLSADGLHARIHAATSTSEVFLDETNVVISPDRRRATFTFASLQARLGKKEADPFTKLEFEAAKQESGVRGENNDLRRIVRDSSPSYRFIKAAPREVALTMNVPSRNILMAKGAGELAVGFTSDDPAAAPPVLLEIEGGTVATVTPAAPFAGAALQLSGHGTYVIALKNLFVDTNVKVKATRANGKLVGERTLTVRE